MPGKIVIKQATARGGTPVRLTFGSDTNYTWSLRGCYINFKATFTDICTVQYKFSNHETGAVNYDVVLYEATVATAAGVLQKHIFPLSSISFFTPVFRGKDACVISIGGASSANEFNYVAVLQEMP